MIVTADPHGDFNATSQILRYSALAREVTVPRVPSLTQTVLAAAAPAAAPAAQACSSPAGSPPPHPRPFSPTGPSAEGYSEHLSLSSGNRNGSPMSSSGTDVHRTTMEAAALEISRLSEDVEYLRQALEAERSAREEAESRLLSMEDRMIELEQAIREECTAEFERRLEMEMARWRATMQAEMERGEEHWGRKIEVFERSMGIAATSQGDGGAPYDHEDENKENVLLENINEENERLRRENEILRRELAAMSPTKKLPLQERGSDAGMASKNNRPAAEATSSRPARVARADDHGEDSLRRRLDKLRVGDGQASVARGPAASGSPKKMRKLATRRWNAFGDDDDNDLY